MSDRSKPSPAPKSKVPPVQKVPGLVANVIKHSSGGNTDSRPLPKPDKR